MKGEINSHINMNTVVKNGGIGQSHLHSKRAKSPTKFRRKNCHIFQLCYTDLCSTHNIPMIFPIKAHLHKRILDFNGDRVKLDEWRPILQALSLDRSLHLVAIRSKASHSKVLEHIDSETKSRTVNKVPVLLTNFIFRRLISSLSRCLSFNSYLKCLELDGLLLTGDYLQSLLSGLEKSSSLQHLSLHRCLLGDDGCQLVCSTLRNLPNILTVDMSGCNISAKGAYSIAKTLQYQNLNRYGENWKQSLRHRTPDTEVMPGLRRVTLNHNPLIGDTGVGYIINVLLDDLWLKALDLQNVGLTSVGGVAVLNLLQDNKNLSILDVYNNPELDKELFESIMKLLATNNLGKASEYHWIQEDTLCLPRKPSYHSRNPSSTQKSSRNYDMSHPSSHNPHSDIRTIRLTQSNVIPTARIPELKLNKTKSASAVAYPNSNLLGRRLPGKYLVCKPGGKQTAALTPNSMSQWDHIVAAGDIHNTHQALAKLQDLSSKLEEEKKKRLEAEKQKANLEFKLETFAQELKKAMMGRVLMDKSVVEEINEAFADFNGFLTIFSKTGIHVSEGNISSGVSDFALSGLTSTNSLSQSISHNSVARPIEWDEISHLTIPLSSLSVKEHSDRKEELKSHSSNEDEYHDPADTAPKHTFIGDGEFINYLAEKKEPLDLKQSPELVFERDEKKESEQSPVEPLIQDGSTMQLRDILKTDALSFMIHRQTNFPHKFLTKSSATSAVRYNESVSSKNESTVKSTASRESIYTNAEQAGAVDSEDEQSWSTVCWSSDSDSSPTATLTDVNVD